MSQTTFKREERECLYELILIGFFVKKISYVKVQLCLEKSKTLKSYILILRLGQTNPKKRQISKPSHARVPQFHRTLLNATTKTHHLIVQVSRY